MVDWKAEKKALLKVVERVGKWVDWWDVLLVDR